MTAATDTRDALLGGNAPVAAKLAPGADVVRGVARWLEAEGVESAYYSAGELTLEGDGWRLQVAAGDKLRRPGEIAITVDVPLLSPDDLAAAIVDGLEQADTRQKIGVDLDDDDEPAVNTATLTRKSADEPGAGDDPPAKPAGGMPAGTKLCSGEFGRHRYSAGTSCERCGARQPTAGTDERALRTTAAEAKAWRDGQKPKPAKPEVKVAAEPARQRRRQGSADGSVYFDSHGQRWVAAIARTVDGQRKRRKVYAATEAEAREKLEELRRDGHPPDVAPGMPAGSIRDQLQPADTYCPRCGVGWELDGGRMVCPDSECGWREWHTAEEAAAR